MSINAINSQFAPQFNPLQRQGFGGAQASQAANPFSANNSLVGGNAQSAFGSGFGAAQAPQDDISALLAAVSAGGAGKKEEKKEDGGIGEILKIVMSLVGKGDDKAKASDEAAPADEAAAGCQDANNDGECDDMSQCVDEDGDGACDTNSSCSGGSCGG